MLLKQYYLGCLAHASYLIADEQRGTAVVVDPQRDIEQYLDDARRQSLHIRYVFLTHFHADFLAGHLELRDRVGATICLGVHAEADYVFRPFRDGETLELGQVRLQILETPGHTPEAISVLVYDLDQDAQHPHAVLTGDTLFIGDVGRPDLMASSGITADTLVEQLTTSTPPVVLDVRTPREWQSKHIAGSLNIPLNQLPGRVQEIPRQGLLVLHCQSGYRSAIAASLLERHGITGADLVGGFAAWEASQLAVASTEAGSA